MTEFAPDLTRPCFYQTLLSTTPSHARTVALALTEQMVRPDQGEEIPTNEWDRLADEVITPDEIYT